jgi:hypothetical protein
MYKQAIIFICTLTVTFCPASALDLLAVNYSGQVARINADTGASVSLGFSGYTGLNSLTNSPYGFLSTSTPDVPLDNPQYLLRINPVTGVAQPVVQLSNLPSTYNVRSLAYGPDGVLYAGIASFAQGAVRSSSLCTINVTTGVVSAPLMNLSLGLQSLTFSPSGDMYSYDTGNNGTIIGLYKLHSGTFEDVNPSIDSGGLFMQSLVFPDANHLMGVTNTSPSTFYRIDPITGATTFAFTADPSDLRGLEIIPEPASLLYCAIAILFPLAAHRARSSEG